MLVRAQLWLRCENLSRYEYIIEPAYLYKKRRLERQISIFGGELGKTYYHCKEIVVVAAIMASKCSRAPKVIGR